MELQRGVCSLCSENGKVFTSSDAEEFLKFLPRILYEHFLSEDDFQKIKDSLKVCSICCYKLELADEAKKCMIKDAANHVSSIEVKECHFCKSSKCVVTVKDDWKYFVQRTETFLKPTDYPVDVCYRCMFYFDTIFNFKIKLLYKFPHLLSTKSPKSAQKQNDTPKRKSVSNSPPSSKKRKIFNNCFTYLQPLCNNNFYHLDEKVKTDPKMYKKIAYVNLKDSKSEKETPKTRPIIKIKLKPRSKKHDKERSFRAEESPQDANFVSQPYVKLCKSADISNQTSKEKQRRHSLPAEPVREGAEEKIDETPKAANATNLDPKRRVSLYAEPNEVEVDSENIPEVENQVQPEEISNIVEKYIKDTTFNDSDKLELLQEIEENNVEKVVEENGTEKIIDEVVEDEKCEEPTEQEEKEEKEAVEEKPESPAPSQEPVTATPTKCDSSEGSDSDVSDQSKSKNTEGDSLSGSERKKKRVTFSDEINQ